MYREKIPGLIVDNHLDKARTATGALKAYEEMLAIFEVRKVEDAEEEVPFTDPATRLSLRKAAR